jgi:hypothetical protein
LVGGWVDQTEVVFSDVHWLLILYLPKYAIIKGRIKRLKPLLKDCPIKGIDIDFIFIGIYLFLDFLAQQFATERGYPSKRWTNLSVTYDVDVQVLTVAWRPVVFFKVNLRPRRP